MNKYTIAACDIALLAIEVKLLMERIERIRRIAIDQFGYVNMNTIKVLTHQMLTLVVKIKIIQDDLIPKQTKLLGL